MQKQICHSELTYKQQEQKYLQEMHNCNIELLFLSLYMDYRIEYTWNYIKGNSIWFWKTIIAKTEIKITTHNEFIFTDKYALMSFEEFKAWCVSQISISKMFM